MEKINLITRYILGFPKTIYINFRLLSFSEAIKLPIVVSHKTYIKSLSGKVTIDSPSFACLKIGFGLTPTTDFKYSRTIINIRGSLIVHGKCRFGAGSKINVNGNGILEIGDNFNMTGGSSIICNKKIILGTHVLVSWNVLIMDTDQHHIMNLDNTIINEDKEIILGSDIWICSGTTILKGAKIGNNNVVGANSLVVNDQSKSNTIIAGNPAKVIKENIKWN